MLKTWQNETHKVIWLLAAGKDPQCLGTASWQRETCRERPKDAGWFGIMVWMNVCIRNYWQYMRQKAIDMMPHNIDYKCLFLHIISKWLTSWPFPWCDIYLFRVSYLTSSVIVCIVICCCFVMTFNNEISLDFYNKWLFSLLSLQCHLIYAVGLLLFIKCHLFLSAWCEND